MALSFSVTPGYSFSDSEKVTYSKLNLLGSPVITLDGQAESGEIADGSITTAKLASTIDINSKLDDHNLALTKLASGTHGQVLYYDTNGDLVTLAPGTSGNFLKTNGAGADPEWAAQSGASTVNISQIVTSGANKLLATDASNNIEWRPDTGLLPSIAAAGSLAYFNGSAWVALGLGANGETLQSNGTAPIWDASSSTSFSAKGRFAIDGAGAMTYSGDTNIDATTSFAAGSGTLTIVFTSSVPVDLPLFVFIRDTSSGASVPSVVSSSRTVSGVVIQFTKVPGTSYAVNMMITT